jgi:hypothetical protein
MCASQPHCRCALSIRRQRRRCKLHERVLCVIYRSRFQVRGCDNPPPAYRALIFCLSPRCHLFALTREITGEQSSRSEPRGSFARNLYLEAADCDRMNFNERGSRCFQTRESDIYVCSCDTKPTIDAKISISKRFDETKSNSSKLYSASRLRLYLHDIPKEESPLKH